MFVQMFLNDHAPKKHGKVKSEEPPNMFWTIAPWAEPIAIFRTRVSESIILILVVIVTQ